MVLTRARARQPAGTGARRVPEASSELHVRPRGLLPARGARRAHPSVRPPRSLCAGTAESAQGSASTVHEGSVRDLLPAPLEAQDGQVRPPLPRLPVHLHRQAGTVHRHPAHRLSAGTFFYFAVPVME